MPGIVSQLGVSGRFAHVGRCPLCTLRHERLALWRLPHLLLMNGVYSEYAFVCPVTGMPVAFREVRV